MQAFRKSESESKTTEQYEVRWKIDSEASGKKHGGQVCQSANLAIHQGFCTFPAHPLGACRPLSMVFGRLCPCARGEHWRAPQSLSLCL